jgi:hypothetical protein
MMQEVNMLRFEVFMVVKIYPENGDIMFLWNIELHDSTYYHNP